MSLKTHLLPLAAAAWACASLAHAAPTAWVATETQAHAVYSRAGDEVLPAERVAPGESLHVVVTLKLRDRAALDARIERIQRGSTADILTPDALLARHMPTAEQAQAVAAHLYRAGFRNIEIAPNRLLVSADGSAAMAEAAFATELHRYTVDGERVYANTAAARVPPALAGIVLAVHGLQNATQAHTMAIAADADAAAAPQAAGVVGHSPTDFPLIYNAQGLAPASSATLGIISEGNMTQTLTDLAAFVARAGYASPNVLVTYVGTHGTDTSGTAEWDLDSQDALAAAGGALKQLIFYTATSLADAPLTQAYNQAVSEHKASVINISLGECETSAKKSGVLASNDQIFAAGVAQGQTFSVSSGDSGSHECTRLTNKGSYPAVSPYVVALGGTTVTTSGTTTYSSESTWKGGGGSPSVTEAAPSWQTASGVLGSSTQRGVPDIALDADPNSGAIIIVNGANAQYGGTSLAAPLFAGFWARIQSANGNQLVSPNPALYQYGVANPGLFHDVTTGSNGGYTAHAGWDYTTGFGSLNVGALSSFITTHSGF